MAISGNVDLPAGLEVVPIRSETLSCEFIVRQGPVAVELKGSFDLVLLNEELLGEFVVRHPDTVELKGNFELVLLNEELLGEFVVRHPDSEELPGEFIVLRGAWTMQGLPISVYRDLGIVA
jgi:hypothetical protein